MITNIFSSYYNSKYIRPDYRINKSEFYYEQAKFDSVLNKYEHPTIIYYNSLDRGDGIRCQALPAAKYWFLQNGATKEMKLQHLKAVESRCADFVITEDMDSLAIADKVNKLKGLGYKYCIDIKQNDRWGMRYRVLLINSTAERKVNNKGSLCIMDLNSIRKDIP